MGADVTIHRQQTQLFFNKLCYNMHFHFRLKFLSMQTVGNDSDNSYSPNQKTVHPQPQRDDKILTT